MRQKVADEIQYGALHIIRIEKSQHSIMETSDSLKIQSLCQGFSICDRDSI
jgi:hypothetical protein